MAYLVKVDIARMVKLAADLHAAPEKLLAKVAKLVQEIQALLLRLIVQRTPRDRGALAQGTFPSEVTVSGPTVSAFIGVQGLASTYVWPVELGARPHWPPTDRIEEWIKRKKIQGVDKKGHHLSLASLAFLISRAIHDHGTIKRFGYHGAEMFAKATDDAEVAVNQMIDRYVDEFLEELS